MAQAESNDTDSAQSRRYETPTFDPRSAFARTLRSGEMARLERLQRPSRVLSSSEPGNTEPDVAHEIERATPRAQCYETPTFDPRSAFARTLRSGEMARLERQRRLPAEKQADVLVATS